MAVEVDGVRDLAVPEDELELGKLGAGVRKKQTRGGMAKVVEGEVLAVGCGAGGAPGVTVEVALLLIQVPTGLAETAASSLGPSVERCASSRTARASTIGTCR